MTRTDQAIKNTCALPKNAGQADFIRHLGGKRLTRDAAIHAKCYECSGGEDHGPCTTTQCSLTPFCQWNKSG